MSDVTFEKMRTGFMGYLVSEVKNAVSVMLEKELAPLGITAAQFRVVVGIAHERASTLSEFAKVLDIDIGAMKRLIDRVEEKGLIRRVPCPNDRRSWNLELTESGQALYPEIMKVVTKVHHRMIEGFTPVEEAQLQYLLRKMIANTAR